MTVVYADSIFLLNTLMDYLLLMAAGRLAGLPLKRKRYLLAALLGGSYAVAVFLPGCGFLASPMVKLAAGTLVGLAAYGGEERLLRLLLLFWGVSCGMAGAVLVVGLVAGGGVPMLHGIFYTDVSVKVLLIAATATYAVLSVVFRTSARHGLRGELLPVKVCIAGKKQELTALWDTGNRLQDPMDGRAVLVLTGQTILECLPRGLRFLLEPERLKHPAETMELLCRAAPELHPRLLPYHAVGVSGGLLLGVTADWIEVAGKRYPHSLLGLSPTELGNGYSALWGGEGKEGRHERVMGEAAAPAEAAGLAFRGSDPLHWGQRRAAAAIGETAGGGASFPAGAGRGAPGAD